jgi:hypothetical protein
MTNVLTSSVFTRIAAGSLAAVVGAMALPVSAQSTVGGGTEIDVHLSSPDIRTNKNAVGDGFTSLVTGPYASPYLRGATAYGHIRSIQSGGQGRTAHLTLELDRIVFADGQARSIGARSTSINEIKDNTTARKALGAGAGAAVGSQTIGRILGGALGGVVGIVGGAAAGFAFAKNNRPNFDVQTGARMVFTVTQPLSVPRRQMESRG